MDRQPMLFYQNRLNILRLLYPNGKVEFLRLGSWRGAWLPSNFSNTNWDAALEELLETHEIVGLV